MRKSSRKASSKSQTFICRVRLFAPFAAFAVFAGGARAEPPDANLRGDALQALKRAAEFYRGKVASHGGYVYYYSDDLRQCWAEGKAPPDAIAVQPPGTPTVGMAFLKAYAATQDRFYLDAAREAARALLYGQLQSGGWTQLIHFGPASRGERVGKYRNGKGGEWNASSLDDGQTQAALEMLVRADLALGFEDADIHDGALYGLEALLEAQFPNGAFPQVWTRPVQPHAAVEAKFPDYDWKTEGRIKNYWDYYTLNDSLAGDVSKTLMVAHQTYGDEKYKAALERLGDFLVLAQMPDPQPGWCQQYNYQMVPIWARKFEPPAITGWESQDVMETLIEISLYTGEQKYLAPIPRALAYFRKCLLPDGRIARYYELKTNKPLYMDAEYRLTYDDSDAPRHYGWKQSVRFDSIEKRLEAARNGAGTGSYRTGGYRVRPVESLEAEARRVIEALDSEGRWIATYAGERLVGQPKFGEAFRYLSSEAFSRNVEILSDYVASTPR